MPRLLIPPTILLLLLVVLMAIDQGDSDADLVLASDSEVFTLDPQRMSWLADMRMAYAMFEGLTRWNTDDFSCVPAGADSWTVSADQRVWTFQLRHDGKWSNGAPVTAHDFVWSWKRLLMPDTAADYSELLQTIKGGREFFQWRAGALGDFDPNTDDAIALMDETDRRFRDGVGLKALNDSTLQITLEQPVPYLLDLMAFAPLLPIYRPAVEGWPTDHTSLDRTWHEVPPPAWSDRRFASLDSRTGRVAVDHGWARPDTLVSNGPFMLDRWRYRRDLRLIRNPFHQSSGDSDINTVLVRSYPDPTTAMLAFRSGEVDWLTGVSSDMRRELVEARAASDSNDPDLLIRSVHARPAYATEYFGFNCRPTLPDGQPNPFHDAAVRRAVAAATDKRTLVELVGGLGEQVVNTFTPAAAITGYESSGGIEFDLERAQREMERAGWTKDADGNLVDGDGEPFPVVELLYSTSSPRYRRLSTQLRDQWQRHLGIDIHLKGQDSKFFGADLRAGNFMVARGSWYGDWGDPTTWLNMFRSDDGNNDRGFANPDIDAQLAKAAAEPNPETRLAMLCAVERELFESYVPLIPICQLVDVSMYDPRALHGMTSHPRLVQYINDIHRSSNDEGDTSP